MAAGLDKVGGSVCLHGQQFFISAKTKSYVNMAQGGLQVVARRLLVAARVSSNSLRSLFDVSVLGINGC